MMVLDVVQGYGVEHGLEGRGRDRDDLVGRGDVDLLEERLVEQTADAVCGLGVDGVAVAGDVEGLVQLGLRVGVV
ncbi:hypothetical protein [Microbacterium oleivorans]|uniref:Uncharacterized protein n=1 Tax=Microbacterium oleivorans TaxID=273677 RepID=A0A7D5EQQ3_9MICO|nr:hypothetical protein [Microbacterium oleivorans]QLD10445.1 hypothetical protein HW566_00770 [Microbacterium oleivorans]